jgi:hypothetical protein
MAHPSHATGAAARHRRPAAPMGTKSQPCPHTVGWLPTRSDACLHIITAGAARSRTADAVLASMRKQSRGWGALGSCVGRRASAADGRTRTTALRGRSRRQRATVLRARGSSLARARAATPRGRCDRERKASSAWDGARSGSLGRMLGSCGHRPQQGYRSRWPIDTLDCHPGEPDLGAGDGCGRVSAGGRR